MSLAHVATRLLALGEGVGIALDSLRANKVRAALTILGIAVGVFVVVVISAAIHGINASVARDFQSAGPTTFFVSRYPLVFEACDGTDETCKWRHNPPLRVADAQLFNELPSVKVAGAQLQTSQPIKYRDRSVSGAQVTGYTANWTQIDQGSDLYPGRSFTEQEDRDAARVAIINDDLARELFYESDPIEKVIDIDGEPFRVIGVFHYQASFLDGGSKSRAIVPIEAARRHMNNTPWNSIGIAVVPRPEVSRDEAIDEVTASLRGRRGLKPSQENNFAIITQDKLFETYNKIFGMFFLVMIVLSAIGLIVGGVGVVAIMMISVTERTREIGVRKALGATRATILWQFLVEAVTLTGIGALIGLALGSLAALLLRSATPIEASVPPWSIVAALLASAFTGILFGIIPAFRAARLDPVTALRYE